MKPVTLGLIVGNRGFFPSHLCEQGRTDMIEVLEAAGFKVIALTPEETTYGSVESMEDSRKCADLFDAHRKEIDGMLVTLPNFGEERAIVNAMRWSGLDVPDTGPGHARRGRHHDHRRPSRQLLRQDVALQQPAPVRYALQPDQASHGGAQERSSSSRIWSTLPPPAVWSEASRACASAPWARGRLPSTPCATAKNYSRMQASVSIPWTSRTLRLGRCHGRR